MTIELQNGSMTRTTAHRLVPTSNRQGYSLVINGKIVGDVYRTGSLPSCTRWHAVIRNWAKDEYETRTGRTWQTILSASTRSGAVDPFVARFVEKS